ncbi:MAG: efflux RND transporter periplasmic adaptor subunit, partial [Rickettsiales bacterium]|nr:efflux RND transporter periplasmic adaptor subunit [Rickettsiales bacterium]
THELADRIAYIAKQYKSQQANKDQDEAQAQSARQQLKQTGVIGKKPTAKQQALQNTIRQFDAAIKSDTATIQQAKAMLARATITAPIDGRAGLKRVDAGNRVSPDDAEGLVEITQMEPATVVFSLAHQHAATVQKTLAQRQPVRVTATDANTGATLAAGLLEMTDSKVNAASGGVRMKASFANEGRRLWPGAMVNVQVSLGTMPDALVVPTASLIRRGEEVYVYKVDENRKTVSPQKVKLALTQGDEAVIAEGVNPGDQLAVENATLLALDKRLQLGNLAPAR